MYYVEAIQPKFLGFRSMFCVLAHYKHDVQVRFVWTLNVFTKINFFILISYGTIKLFINM